MKTKQEIKIMENGNCNQRDALLLKLDQRDYERMNRDLREEDEASWEDVFRIILLGGLTGFFIVVSVVAWEMRDLVTYLIHR